MTDEIDDDDDETRPRVLSPGKILAFVAGFWVRRPVLLGMSIAFTVIAVLLEIYLPWASADLVRVVATSPADPAAAWRACWVFVGVFFVISIIRNSAFRFWNPLAAANMAEMTNEGFSRVQSFSAEWHANNFAGATVRRLSRAMWGYDTVSDSAVLWLGPALLVLIGLSVSMLIRWPLVGVFSLVVVGLYIASNVLLGMVYVRPAQLKSVKLDSRIGGALADSISSNPAVKAFGAEDREAHRIAKVMSDWRSAVVITWNRYIDVWIIQNMFLVVLQGGLAAMMVWLWSKGRADAGDVAFVITSFMTMSGYLRNIGEQIRNTQKGLDDIQDVAAWAIEAPQVSDAPGAKAFAGNMGEVVFERVTFGYTAAERPIYEDFSLRIQPGERIALVGPTGAGKSTFVKLLQRLYDLDGGAIHIDGQDIAGVTQTSLRRGIAVVPQDPALFHRSVGENIAYARPDATPEEIALAAKRARADDFIARLPGGYDTLVGERGVKLSGGERQRVAIARAFLADAPILVLDEATSSLDVETERAIQAATEELMAGRTTIVIAHRLSTIRSADRILVFQDGRVVEEGTHRLLVAKGGVYARLNAVAEGAA